MQCDVILEELSMLGIRVLSLGRIIRSDARNHTTSWHTHHDVTSFEEGPLPNAQYGFMQGVGWDRRTLVVPHDDAATGAHTFLQEMHDCGTVPELIERFKPFMTAAVLGEGVTLTLGGDRKFHGTVDALVVTVLRGSFSEARLVVSIDALPYDLLVSPDGVNWRMVNSITALFSLTPIVVEIVPLKE